MADFVEFRGISPRKTMGTPKIHRPEDILKNTGPPNVVKRHPSLWFPNMKLVSCHPSEATTDLMLFLDFSKIVVSLSGMGYYSFGRLCYYL